MDHSTSRRFALTPTTLPEHVFERPICQVDVLEYNECMIHDNNPRKLHCSA